MTLLRNCLESETENSKSILSGYVDNFQSLDSEDAGWGCGWRNIQMLSSHLLARRPEAREILFGGLGFVPNIPLLHPVRVKPFLDTRQYLLSILVCIDSNTRPCLTFP